MSSHRKRPPTPACVQCKGSAHSHTVNTRTVQCKWTAPHAVTHWALLFVLETHEIDFLKKYFVFKKPRNLLHVENQKVCNIT